MARKPAAKAFTPTARGPLDGVRVVDLSRLVAGNVLTLQLADFGAEVIKIEPPAGGDPLRKWRLLLDGTSVWWQVQSRNKRSVALDLRQPDGQALVRQLAAEADVLIENFRPGALEGWGLGPEVLQALNPRLIVLHETVISAADSVALFQTAHPRDDDQVSYHLLIGRQGRLLRLVPHMRRKTSKADRGT